MARAIPAYLPDTWIHGMEAVSEARQIFAVRGDKGVDGGLDRFLQRCSVSLRTFDAVKEFDGLLSGAAVDIIERIQRRGHRTVQRQAATHRHARNRNRRRMRTVIHRRHQRRLEQTRLARARQVAAQHEPDHLRKADRANQFLNRISAHLDRAWVDVDDRRAPVIGSEDGGIDGSVVHSALFNG
jgi:hypothetical protein